MHGKYAPYHKNLLKLAFPLVLTQVGQTIVQLVDSAMVGRVGTVELAAASFAGSIFIIILVFGQGLMIAVTPLLGQSFGAGNRINAALYIKNSYALYALVTLMLFLLSWAISWLMPHMGQSEAVLNLALPYYRLLCFSLIPTLFYTSMKQVCEGLGNTTTAMTATLISNILNVLLNWLLIFGKAGFPRLGLMGAGYATFISRLILPAIIYAGLKRLTAYRDLKSRIKASSLSACIFSSLLKTGFPIAFQILVEVLMFALAGVMMGWIGAVPQAANQVAGTLTGLTFMAANGVAQAVTIRLSLLRGKPDPEKLKNTALSSVIIVTAFMTGTGFMFYALRYALPRLFTADPAVIEQCAALLILGAFFQFFDGVQCVGLGILRGFADVKVPMAAAVVSYIIIGLPLGYLSAFVWNRGAVGIWYGHIAGLGLAGLFFFLRIRYSWNRLINS